MWILGVLVISTIFIIAYAIGSHHGERDRDQKLLEQLYTLSHFLDGEAKKTADEIFNHLDRLGFIDEADFREKIRQYRKNQKQNGKED